ncbi:MAG: two component LuxR family transcriptional regulator [Mycobacterium sp.]|nr:two component LuxR family transcriptional regulator [Mycobacterium sp.]
MTTDRPLLVLIADDHPVFREGLRAQLDAAAGVEVAGEVANGTDAVAAALALEPDVVLMDLHMPGCGGVEATRQIAAALPRVSVVALTMDDDDDLMFAALRAGARGYLLKESTGEGILRALRAAERGEALFGPRIADRVLSFFCRAGSVAAVAAFPRLTNREREVLDFVARGLDNHAIARRLTLSEKTVRNRVSDIFAKLHVAGRAEAVAAARDAGLGTGP